MCVYIWFPSCFQSLRYRNISPQKPIKYIGLPFKYEYMNLCIHCNTVCISITAFQIKYPILINLVVNTIGVLTNIPGKLM